MRLNNSLDLGRYIRERRKVAGLNQSDLATRAGVSRRWLSDVEAGKPTIEFGLILHVTAALGLVLDLHPAPEPELNLDEYLKRFGGTRS